MPKINTYAIDGTVTNNDKVIGTDSATGETKNYLVSDIVALAGGGGGGSTTFTGLTDTPSTYSGQSLKLTQVNSVESAIEFTSTPVVDSIQLSGGTGSQGEVTWDTDNETLNLVQNGIDLKVGQDVQLHVTLHGSAASISQGDAVVAVGTTGGSGKILVCKASISEYNTCTGLSVTEIPAKYVIGVAAEAITNNGKVTAFGKVAGSGFTQNSVYYVNESTGGLTLTKPTSGLDMPIAFAINSSLLMVRTTPINELYIEHGETAYGWGNHASAGYLTDVADDTTPQLGGNLDVNGRSIVSTSDADIVIQPNGTGDVQLGNFVFAVSQEPSVAEDNYVLTYDDGTGTIQLEPSAGGGGTVTSVGLSVPTGFAVTGSPVTSSGTLALAFDTGYSLPSNTLQSQWNAKMDALSDDPNPNLAGTLNANSQDIINLGSINATAVSTIISGAAAGATALQNVVEDATPELGGTLDAANNDITNVDKITAKEYVAGNQTITGLGIGSISVDATAGTFVEYTLNENLTSFSVNNMVKGEPLTIMINTGVGGYSISGWAKDSAPANFLWSGGTAPTITATASKVDIVTLICDGTNIYASIVQNF